MMQKKKKKKGSNLIAKTLTNNIVTYLSRAQCKVPRDFVFVRLT